MAIKKKVAKKATKKVAKKKVTKPKGKFKKKNILLVSSECVPFAKTGGLADVVSALGKYFRREGHDVRVVIPRYWSIDKKKWGLKKILAPMGVPMGGCTMWSEVFEGDLDGTPVYFIEHEAYFGRAGFYDDGDYAYHDNSSRFGFLSRASLQLCRDLNFRPDIVHCNDWQTALIPAYLKTRENYDDFFSKTASVFSIHNMAYQGSFNAEDYGFLDLNREDYDADRFESFHGINFMKGAFFYADAISTVSPTYANEILSEPGACGLGTYIERRKDDVVGILNGADYEHWDPATDPLIPSKYSLGKMAGKAKCKKALQEQFMLEVNPKIPIIGVVSRFAHQKGFDVVAPVMKHVLKSMIVQFVFLGTGEKELEDFYGGLPAEFPGQVGSWIGYDNEKAHLIEAGADFFLMPSFYEPCGLNQIYSLKYGTLPIVRETGGLCDTVEQYDESTGGGTGFRFQSADPNAIYYTVGWAVSTFYDRPNHIKKMQKVGMKKHFGWEEAVPEYEKLYQHAAKRRRTWK